MQELNSVSSQDRGTTENMFILASARQKMTAHAGVNLGKAARRVINQYEIGSILSGGANSEGARVSAPAERVSERASAQESVVGVIELNVAFYRVIDCERCKQNYNWQLH